MQPNRPSSADSRINRNLWNMAEQETLFLLRSYHLSPPEVVRQYTGQAVPNAQLADAVDAVYSFNLHQAAKPRT